MSDEENNLISVIIPVTERADEVEPLYTSYKAVLETLDLDYEIIYVIDGSFPEVTERLQGLLGRGEKLKMVKLTRAFGEATALTVGFDQSSGNTILTLPAYEQVKPEGISQLVASLEGYDMVVARRWPRVDSLFNRMQTSLFHTLLKRMSGKEFHDLGCGVRLFRRHVIKEVNIYGDQHRFLPLLADKYGFKVTELDIPQSDKDRASRVYSPGVYLRRFLDILSIFFLVKFTKKPLRFFGLLGSGIFSIGALISVYLLIERMFFGAPLGGRPMLLLASLLVVMGIQFFAIGLLGEIIIFTHAKDMKEYAIDEIVN